MNADHDLERRLTDFYATEAPRRAPDRVLEAALATIDTTRQRRALRVPWRFPHMNGLARYALAAVAVIAIGVGFAVLQPGAVLGPGGDPQSSPSPSPSPEAITRHAIEESFFSSINGISVGYPTGWSTRAAVEPWTTDDPPAFDGPFADVMYHPVREAGLFLLATSKLIGSASFDAAATTLLAGGECGASRPVTVDGAAGVMGTTCHMAVVQSSGRLYVILLYVSADAVAIGGDLQEEFDDTFFESVLATVHLDPASADGATPSPATQTATAFRRPFTYVLPAGTEFGSNVDGATYFELRVPAFADAGTPSGVIVQAIGGGRTDPCAKSSAAAPIEAGPQAVIDYLKTIPSLGVTGESAAIVSGLPARQALVDVADGTSTCPELWAWSTSPDSEPVPSGMRLRMIAVDVGGEHLVLTIFGEDVNPAFTQIADDLIGSFRFLPATSPSVSPGPS